MHEFKDSEAKKTRMAPRRAGPPMGRQPLLFQRNTTELSSLAQDTRSTY